MYKPVSVHSVSLVNFDAQSPDLKSTAYTVSAISIASPRLLPSFITPIGAVYDVTQVITYDSV